MPIYIKLGDIKGESFANLNQISVGGGPARWLPYRGAPALVAEVRRQHPQGVNVILIGLLSVPGYRLTVAPNGIIAILIGLLLPAVQKVREAASTDRLMLKGALKSNGKLAVAMGDGSVRVLSTGPASLSVDPSDASGHTLIQQFLSSGIVSPRDPSSGLPTG